MLNNLFGFLYVLAVVSNSRIYGGLGLIPVFMAGIYFSWLVLLFGAWCQLCLSESRPLSAGALWRKM